MRASAVSGGTRRSNVRSMQRLVRLTRRWWADDSAQELAEYAWLAFSVGLVGLLSVADNRRVAGRALHGLYRGS